MKKNKELQVGDSVRVKNGTKDPDFEIDIGGWQGRVSEIQDDIICIDWDSSTLSIFPDKYLSQCEEDGLDWKRIYLEKKDVEFVNEVNADTELVKKRKEIELKHYWDWLGDTGKRISKVLKDINPDDDLAAFDAWQKYLKRSISFPFEAEIAEYQEKGAFRQGDKIKIHSILGYEDLYGIIAKIRFNGVVYHFPLCDVDVLDNKSKNYQVVNDYKNWFGNR